MSTFKERARLEEALSSESGQQQLAIRTFKVQLNKQTEQLNALQGQLERAKLEKDEKRQAALKVQRSLVRPSVRPQTCSISFTDQTTTRAIK